MARRIESALASIFLPRDSIYTQLDEEESAAEAAAPTTRRTSPPPQQQREQEAEDDDPFAPTTSIISTSVPHSHSDKQRQRERQREGATRDSTSTPSPSPLPAPARSTELQESYSTPFHDQPLSHSSSHSHSQQPLLAQSITVSSIGNPSLIGLLGGTRLDFGAAGAGYEVGAGVHEEEEEDGDAVGVLRVGARGGRISGMSLAQSHALHSSLPPPPSALSPSSSPSPSTSDEEEEEEEEDDGPPSDLTSRLPLHTRSHLSSSHASSPSHPHQRRRGPTGGILGAGGGGLSARERALWRWINTEDLDGFLQKVYLYYVGKGVWTMVLGRVVDLLTVGWVISFSTFLVGCIDYSRLWEAKTLSEVVVPRCVARFSTLHTLLFLSFLSFYLYRLIRFGLGVKELWEMHEFFEELLGVEENDIQTIPWSTIVSRLSSLRASHPSALSSRSSSSSHAHAQNQNQRLDAHDIANRIMREENYLIALFNKDVLDLSMPVPSWAERWVGRRGRGRGRGKEREREREKGRGMLTKTLQWNLEFCLVGFLFGRDGQVRRAFLGERNRTELAEALRRRFILMGIINAVFAPFIVLYLLMYSFFRYFEEYHQNPSSISSRTFTPLARLSFREFNELPHLFSHRLSLAHPLATTYIAHFPKAKTALLSRFVAFIAGSFAAVLILFSLVDPDAFLHFEVTKGRTTLFWIGVFGAILAVARGMVPEEHRVVDPGETMKRIVEQTHWCPEEWRGKLHSAEVHTSFSLLFPMKLVLFLQELSSVLLTPFILIYSLPSSSLAIVDFFREFTVHIDGLGYVCSFAVFDFKRHGDVRFGAPVQGTEERWKSGEGKMEKSFLNFAAHNPSWIPRDQTQSLFLSKMTEAAPSSSHPSAPPPPRHAQATSTGLHPRFSSSTAHRGQRYAGGGLGASILEEGSTFGNLAMGGGGGGGASSLPSSRILDPPRGAAGGSRLRPSATSPPPSSSRRILSPPRSLPRLINNTNKNKEDPIIEESNLDGQSFVAPTEGRPFGLSSAEEEEEIGEIGGESRMGQEGEQQGLGGMLGELYGMQGRRW